MKLGFILTQVTLLRYFMPLIIEGNKRGIKSTVFIFDNSPVKYNAPSKHMDIINSLSSKYGFEIKQIENIDRFDGIVFILECSGMEAVQNKHKMVVLTATYDFVRHYDKYVDRADMIVFPSKFFAEYYEKISDKNLYVGSPKYDIELNKEEIKDKYNIGNKRNVLFLSPRPKYEVSDDRINKIYSHLHMMDFDIIVKTRGKDPVSSNLRGDKYFEDYSWFPHTSMELMEVCDLVVNFDSTGIKECVMMDIPVINFHVKPLKRLDFLYNYDYCKELKLKIKFDEFKKEVNILLGKDLSDEFKKARKKHLFEKGNISGRILDALK